MCESRATVLGSLIGDEEDFMKEINNSLTNSFCLVPWRLASATLWISRMKESQESLFLSRHEKIMCSEIGGKIFGGGLREAGTSDEAGGTEGGSDCWRYVKVGQIGRTCRQTGWQSDRQTDRMSVE